MGKIYKMGNFLVEESTYEDIEKEILENERLIHETTKDYYKMKKEGLISNENIEFSEESSNFQKTQEEQEYKTMDNEKFRKDEISLIEILEEIEKKYNL